MKKFVGFLIVMTMILSMTACGNVKTVEDDSQSENSTAAENTTENSTESTENESTVNDSNAVNKPSKTDESSYDDKSNKVDDSNAADDSSKVEESNKVDESGSSTETSVADSTTRPVESSKPAESSKPTETSKPVESSKPAESTQPAHTHNWQPVYTTIHHDEEYQKVFLPGDCIEYTLACGCGYDCGAVRYTYELVSYPASDGDFNFIATETVRHLVSDESVNAHDELYAHRAEEFSKAHDGVTYTIEPFTTADGTELLLYKCPVCNKTIIKEYKATGYRDRGYGDDPDEEWSKHTAVNEVNVTKYICNAAGISHNNYFMPGHRVWLSEETLEEVLFREAYDEQVLDHFACSCGQTW